MASGEMPIMLSVRILWVTKRTVLKYSNRSIMNCSTAMPLVSILSVSSSTSLVFPEASCLHTRLNSSNPTTPSLSLIFSMVMLFPEKEAI